MDPISLAIGALIASGIGPAVGMGAGSAAPALAGAAAAVTTAPAWMVPAGIVAGTGALGSAGATGALGLAAQQNPFTAQGLHNATAEIHNQVAGSVADIVNPLNIPGIHVHVN